GGGGRVRVGGAPRRWVEVPGSPPQEGTSHGEQHPERHPGPGRPRRHPRSSPRNRGLRAGPRSASGPRDPAAAHRSPLSRVQPLGGAPHAWPSASPARPSFARARGCLRRRRGLPAGSPPGGCQTATMQQRTDVVAAGRVAVVTGAASGIGFGLSERFAREGMRVVMADIEHPALVEAAEVLAGRGAEVLPVPTDVARPEQLDSLRDRALGAFGAVHVVCNDAGGAGLGRPVWEMTPREWEWVLGVNLWGVINGIRSFLPVLRAQEDAHIVNTASVAGLVAGVLGPYSVTKHGV